MRENVLTFKEAVAKVEQEMVQTKSSCPHRDICDAAEILKKEHFLSQQSGSYRCRLYLIKVT